MDNNRDSGSRASGVASGEKISAAGACLGAFEPGVPVPGLAMGYLSRNRVPSNSSQLLARGVLSTVAAGVLLLTLASSSRAQNADAQPAALSKQRTALYLQATRAPLASLEKDVNHLAILSETCRVEHGFQACGLPEKPLDSSKLEDRYAYYVRRPVEAHSKVQGVKINRRNWQGSK